MAIRQSRCGRCLSDDLGCLNGAVLALHLYIRGLGIRLAGLGVQHPHARLGREQKLVIDQMVVGDPAPEPLQPVAAGLGDQPHRDASLRYLVHGPIRPMEEPGFLARLFGAR